MKTESDATEVPAGFHLGGRRTLHQRRRHAMVERLVDGLGGRAFDYGCGWGDIAHLVAPGFTSIEGVDVDGDRVAFAAAEYAPITFRQCPPEGLPDVEPESFDVVLSIVVLPFVPSNAGYLAECRRILRDGGHLVLATVNPRDWRRRLRHTLRRSRARSPLQALQFLETEIRDAGFSIERRDGFYDPPFDWGLRHAGDAVLAGLNLLGHVLQLRGMESYVGFRCVADRSAA